MQALIKKIQGEWKAAKDAAQAQCTNNGRYEMAEKLGACDMFKGNETLEELIGMMFSPRGIEFLTTYNFPSLATFRRFKNIIRNVSACISTAAKSRFQRPEKSF